MNVNPLHQESSKRLRSPSPTTKSALYDSDSDSDSDEKPPTTNVALYDSDSDSDSDEKPSHPPPPPTPPTKKPKSDNPKKEKPPRVDMGAGEGVGEVVGHDEYGEWRTVPGFPPEFLLASSKGFVRNRCVAGGRRLGKPSPGSQQKETGYWNVKVHGTTYKVHQVILRSFVGPRPSPMMTCDHINRNRSDNSFENLTWATSVEQIANQGTHNKHRDVNPILVRCTEWPVTTPSMWFVNTREASKTLGCSSLSNVVNNSTKSMPDKEGNRWLAKKTPPLESQEDLPVDPDYVDSNGDSKPQLAERWVEAFYYGKRVPNWRVSNRGRAQCRRTQNSKWGHKFTPKPTATKAYADIKTNTAFHVTVLSSFCDKPLKGFIVDHIDRDKASNLLTNLRVVSRSENNKNRHWSSEMFNARKHPVEARRKDAPVTTPWHGFESQSAAGRALNINHGCINAYLRGKYSHARGYVFRHIE